MTIMAVDDNPLCETYRHITDGATLWAQAGVKTVEQAKLNAVVDLNGLQMPDSGIPAAPHQQQTRVITVTAHAWRR